MTRVGMVVRITPTGGRVLVDGMITTFRYMNVDARSVVLNRKNEPTFKAYVIGGKPLSIVAPKVGDKLRFETFKGIPYVYQWAYEREWMQVKHGETTIGMTSTTKRRQPRSSIDWTTAVDRANELMEQKLLEFVGTPKPPVVQEDVDGIGYFAEAVEAGAQALETELERVQLQQTVSEPDVQDDDDIVAWVSEYLRPRTDVAANTDELEELAAEYIAG